MSTQDCFLQYIHHMSYTASKVNVSYYFLVKITAQSNRLYIWKILFWMVSFHCFRVDSIFKNKNKQTNQRKQKPKLCLGCLKICWMTLNMSGTASTKAFISYKEWYTSFILFNLMSQSLNIYKGVCNLLVENTLKIVLLILFNMAIFISFHQPK